jgi:dTDP-4-amino-4,6-dideoxygalactose transaminase
LKQGIEAQIGTYSSHIQPLYGYCDPCPNSFDIFNRALALPMYFSLKEKNIDDICDNLEQIFEELA